jgi:hypothetical protein
MKKNSAPHSRYSEITDGETVLFVIITIDASQPTDRSVRTNFDTRVSPPNTPVITWSSGDEFPWADVRLEQRRQFGMWSGGRGRGNTGETIVRRLNEAITQRKIGRHFLVRIRGWTPRRWDMCCKKIGICIVRTCTGVSQGSSL